MNCKKKLYKEVHRLHQGLDRVKKVIEALPDDLPGNPYVHVGYWGVYIEIPYDWEIYKALRRALGSNFQSHHVFDHENGDKFLVLSPSEDCNRELYVTLKPLAEGSNCHLEKAGERTIDVYRVICD